MAQRVLHAAVTTVRDEDRGLRQQLFVRQVLGGTGVRGQRWQAGERASTGRDDDEHVLVGERLQRGRDQLAEVLVGDRALRHVHDRARAVQIAPPRRARR